MILLINKLILFRRVLGHEKSWGGRSGLKGARVIYIVNLCLMNDSSHSNHLVFTHPFFFLNRASFYRLVEFGFVQ